MRPSIITTDEQHDFVVQKCADNEKRSDIIVGLQEEFGIGVSPRTLGRYITDHDLQRNKAFQTEDPDFDLFFIAAFFDTVANDEQLAVLCTQAGWKLSKQQAQRQRWRHNLYTRRTARRPGMSEDELKGVIEDHFTSDSIRSYGREFLYTHFRQKGYLITKHRLYNAVKELDPEGVALRTSGLNRRRRDFIVPGPNWMWSLDGYCKFERVGIQIYAAIDTFSRMILWVYCGISARTETSVKRQYCDYLQKSKLFPELLRTDHGGETGLLAAAHYELSNAARTSSVADIAFKDCYLFGTSTANQRIESWWGQLNRGQLERWREWFARLIEVGEFNGASLADRIAFLAIYIPVMRKEIASFVTVWNAHTIRKQPKRPYVISGKPTHLYHDPQAQNFGWRPDEALLNQLSEEVSDWNPEPYLPDDTVEWCSNKIVELGYDPSSFNSEEIAAEGVFTHGLAYAQLRLAVKEHIGATTADPFHPGPRLKELEKPLAQNRRQPPAIVQEALRDTHNPEFACEVPLDNPDNGPED